MLNMENFTDFMLREIAKEEERFFIEAVKKNAVPSVKGEITKSKLKWRGIKIARQNIGFDSYSWVEQRGKRISETLHINLVTKYPN